MLLRFRKGLPMHCPQYPVMTTTNRPWSQSYGQLVTTLDM